MAVLEFHELAVEINRDAFFVGLLLRIFFSQYSRSVQKQARLMRGHGFDPVVERDVL